MDGEAWINESPSCEAPMRVILRRRDGTAIRASKIIMARQRLSLCLTAAFWTRDAVRGLRLAKRIDPGSIWINDWAKVFDSTEEGGFKASGLGRLNDVAALEDFVEYKHICVNTKG